MPPGVVPLEEGGRVSVHWLQSPLVWGVNSLLSLVYASTPSGPPQHQKTGPKAGTMLSPQSGSETALNRPSKLCLKMEAGHEGVAQSKVSATLTVYSLCVPVPGTEPGTHRTPIGSRVVVVLRIITFVHINITSFQRCWRSIFFKVLGKEGKLIPYDVLEVLSRRGHSG